jgi:hypothetical protein
MGLVISLSLNVAVRRLWESAVYRKEKTQARKVLGNQQSNSSELPGLQH